MNVTFLSGISRQAGGVFFAASSLGKALCDRGLDVSVLGSLDSFTEEDSSTWHPVRNSPYKSYGPLGYAHRLGAMLENTQPDIVHLHGLWMFDQWTSLTWQKRKGGAVVISPHGMLDPWAIKNSAWKKKLVSALFSGESLKKASCIHALCRSEADAIREYGLTAPIAVIPNGVDLPSIESHVRPQGKKKLLFLGRIHPKKGLAELITAWAKAMLPDWELLIVGWDDGGHEPGLKGLVEELGCVESISFLGPQFGTEKTALLRSVDGFILPSFSEGLPMSVLEAWSYGLPVLMTDFCNIPEGFTARAALRLQVEIPSIVSGLREFDSMSDSERAEMGTRGRRLVENFFSWAHIAGETKAVYEWCLGGDKPACVLNSEQLS